MAADAGRSPRLFSIVFGPARLHFALDVTGRYVEKNHQLGFVSLRNRYFALCYKFVQIAGSRGFYSEGSLGVFHRACPVSQPQIVHGQLVRESWADRGLRKAF